MPRRNFPYLSPAPHRAPSLPSDAPHPLHPPQPVGPVSSSSRGWGWGSEWRVRGWNSGESLLPIFHPVPRPCHVSPKLSPKRAPHTHAHAHTCSQSSRPISPPPPPSPSHVPERRTARFSLYSRQRLYQGSSPLSRSALKKTLPSPRA